MEQSIFRQSQGPIGNWVTHLICKAFFFIEITDDTCLAEGRWMILQGFSQWAPDCDHVRSRFFGNQLRLETAFFPNA